MQKNPIILVSMSSKNILILDDDPVRHRAYAKKYQDDKVIHAWTYTEFVAAYKSSDWDIVHLDHDIGDNVRTPDTWTDGWGVTRIRTGRDAADFITSSHNRPKKVVIHSINPVGSRAIMGVLRQADIPVVWEPFNQ